MYVPLICGVYVYVLQVYVYMCTFMYSITLYSNLDVRICYFSLAPPGICTYIHTINSPGLHINPLFTAHLSVRLCDSGLGCLNVSISV